MPKAKVSSSSSSFDTKPYINATTTTITTTTNSSPKKWSKQDKINLLLAVLEASGVGSGKGGIDFGGIANKEEFEGRSKTQVYDQWRQHVLPALKRDGSVIGTTPVGKSKAE